MMKYRDTVKTKRGHVGVIILRQSDQVYESAQVCVLDVDGNIFWEYENELTLAPEDEQLTLHVVEKEEVCSCCDGSGYETVFVKEVRRKST